MGFDPRAFLTPAYDITFKPKKGDEYKRRRMTDAYSDFQTPDTDRPVVFIGSKEYVPLFVSLTSKLTVPRTVFYRSGNAPEAPGCRTVRFHTSRVTNWQYGCADAFISGDLPF